MLLYSMPQPPALRPVKLWGMVNFPGPGDREPLRWHLELCNHKPATSKNPWFSRFLLLEMG